MARAGRPKAVRDEKIAKQVQNLASLGLSQEDAGNVLGFSPDSIQRRYSEDWAKGKSVAKAKIAERLFKKALDGDNACMMFWLKTQAHWREVQHVDMSSSDGTMAGPLDVRVKFIDTKKKQEEA